MPNPLRVAAIQCALGDSVASNVARVADWVEVAAREHHAQVVLPPELFEGPYFCTRQDADVFTQARPIDDDHPTLSLMRELARRHKVVIPVSLFERDGPHYYNSVAVVDADGAVLGVYRKSHIPDGPGYQEKFYFRPGNTDLTVFHSRYGRLGVGICWDQWYPEVARCLLLRGAELLLYPTAIGSEPASPQMDTQKQWRRAMVGHAVHNLVPVVAANRVGTEAGQTYYGSSFVAGPDGEMLAQLDRQESGVAVASVDLQAARSLRAGWGFFRDRRPDLYGPLVAR